MTDLMVIERQGLRVLTTAQLAECYETTTKIISQNFKRNSDRYEEGKHYICLKGDELRAFRANLQIEDLPKNLNVLYLWTERGALLHAKSLNTDKAWEVYGELVETYFRAKTAQTALQNLSPQLQLLINIETEQKRQQKAIEDTNRRIDNIGEVIALDVNSWRREARSLITKIAQSIGGFDHIKDVNSEVYRLVEERAGVRLDTRLTNKRMRMADEGVCKSKRDKLTKVDIIADDKKLIEIYIAIVKEMAIKYSVDLTD